MRYFLRPNTLFLRGDFTAVSSGVNGGIAKVSTILNRTVQEEWDHREPLRFLEQIVAAEGFSNRFFGLLTAVEMRNLCILQYDFITAFITAGVTNPNPDAHTINIILHSAEGLTNGALLGSIITATEAKVKAVQAMGYPFTGTTTDAVIVACEDVPLHEYAGTLTEPGKRIYQTVLFGVQEALRRQEGTVRRTAPSFFIYSRYGGDHWVEWQSKDCPYYPCHFEGQSCDFCYCPFYPCKDESLGHWVESSQGRTVWSCSSCDLVHIPRIAAYIKENPEATLKELKAVKRD
jgi:adenosylcobinamide hydrolase